VRCLDQHDLGLGKVVRLVAPVSVGAAGLGEQSGCVWLGLPPSTVLAVPMALPPHGFALVWPTSGVATAARVGAPWLVPHR
jgi:hypothetical protein